jgi:hypothetical protein
MRLKSTPTNSFENQLFHKSGCTRFRLSGHSLIVRGSPRQKVSEQEDMNICKENFPGSKNFLIERRKLVLPNVMLYVVKEVPFDNVKDETTRW